MIIHWAQPFYELFLIMLLVFLIFLVYYGYETCHNTIPNDLHSLEFPYSFFLNYAQIISIFRRFLTVGS